MGLLDKKNTLTAIIAVALALAVGVLIGYFSAPSVDNQLSAGYVKDKFSDNAHLVKSTIQSVSTDRLRSYLLHLTEEPHIAGQERDKDLADWIRQEWLQSGLDRVDTAEYDFYLSWPNKSFHNKVFLRDDLGNIHFSSHHKELPLIDGDSHPNFITAFNAYSPAATVLADIVYVNYGRVEDLREMENVVGEGFLKGKICLARYGKIFRGNIVRNCQDKGAEGVVLYSDPADVALNGTDPDNVYPNTAFLPGTGIQRGSVYIGDGDPLSPSWPSVPNSYRISPEESPGLPKIPSQPIGYDDAVELMEKMGGQAPPNEGWKGGLEGVEYRLGGSMKAPWESWHVMLSVYNYADTVRSSNLIGYIEGSVEPDRYVILGNHRDAWGYGAADPSSGTAQLMEVVRSLGEMMKNGWRPRRTIVFASWTAEEYGLEGSFEWVTQHLNKLTHRTVGVVNTDVCVSGPIVDPQASPLLMDVVMDAIKEASAPTSDEHRSYYDFWEEWLSKVDGDDGDKKKKPKVGHLGSGSDHAAFAFFAGIPALNLGFDNGTASYPTYHTGYETFYLMDKIIDPGFKIHRACAQTSIHALLNMADSAIIPYNLNYFPEEMEKALDAFVASNVSKTLEDNGATLAHLREAVVEFKEAAAQFMENLESDESLKSDPIRLRMVNDQMLEMERGFLMDGGLPDRPDVRHAIFAPGKFNKYRGGAFPAIPDLLHDIDKLEPASAEHKKRWGQIKKHVSDLMIMTQNAARFLRPLQFV